MKAFHNIKTEMRETCLALTHPSAGEPQPCARIGRGGGGRIEDDEADTHIEPWIELAFRGLTHASETGEPFALVSCFMNGEPAALIAATHQDSRSTHVLPLFIAVQSWMKFSGHAEEEGEGDDGEEEGSGRRSAEDAPSP
jgi:hypothetical protein